MTKKLTIILGAGASHSLNPDPKALDNQGFRPPLASDIFRGNREFRAILNKYPLAEILEIDKADVEKDEKQAINLHMTSVDAYRIISDLVGRGLLRPNVLGYVEKMFKLDKTVKPILHPNQYFHLLKWLKAQRQVSDKELQRLKKIMKEEVFSGL